MEIKNQLLRSQVDLQNPLNKFLNKNKLEEISNLSNQINLKRSQLLEIYKLIGTLGSIQMQVNSYAQSKGKIDRLIQYSDFKGAQIELDWINYQKIERERRPKDEEMIKRKRLEGELKEPQNKDSSNTKNQKNFYSEFAKIILPMAMSVAGMVSGDKIIDHLNEGKLVRPDLQKVQKVDLDKSPLGPERILGNEKLKEFNEKVLQLQKKYGVQFRFPDQKEISNEQFAYQPTAVNMANLSVEELKLLAIRAEIAGLTSSFYTFNYSNEFENKKMSNLRTISFVENFDGNLKGYGDDYAGARPDAYMDHEGNMVLKQNLNIHIVTNHEILHSTAPGHTTHRNQDAKAYFDMVKREGIRIHAYGDPKKRPAEIITSIADKSMQRSSLPKEKEIARDIVLASLASTGKDPQERKVSSVFATQQATEIFEEINALKYISKPNEEKIQEYVNKIVNLQKKLQEDIAAGKEIAINPNVEKYKQEFLSKYPNINPDQMQKILVALFTISSMVSAVGLFNLAKKM